MQSSVNALSTDRPQTLDIILLQAEKIVLIDKSGNARANIKLKNTI